MRSDDMYRLPSTLRHFIQSRRPSRATTVAALRQAYGIGFVAQLLVVALIGLVLRLILGPPGAAAPVLEQVLIAAAVVMLPVALYVSHRMSARGGKRAALAGVTSLGVLLSTPGWFFVFGWLVGASEEYLIAFVAILLAFAIVGFVVTSRFASLATRPTPPASRARRPARKGRQEGPRR